MSVDPQVQVVLDSLEAMGGPKLVDGTPQEARAAFAQMTAAIGPPPGGAVVVEDRVVPGSGVDVPVRIYRPENEGLLPVVVYFHGGGWVIGSVETHDDGCRRIALGVPAVVVSVDYRLAPEHCFPAAVGDCFDATKWVSSHAAELGADVRRLAVAGDSAGANLGAVVARRARDGGGPPIAFQLLVYPVTDLTRSFGSYVENAEGYLLTAKDMEWFIGHYVDDADLRHPDASPLFAESLAGLPPALVITAEFDPLRDEGEAYAQRLREAGGLATMSRYDGMIHGFFGMQGLLDGATKAMAEAIAALRAALSVE
jgi:acetyl esterase